MHKRQPIYQYRNIITIIVGTFIGSVLVNYL